LFRSDELETALEKLLTETDGQGYIKNSGDAKALDRMIQTYMMNQSLPNKCAESQNASHMRLDRFEPIGYAMLVHSGGW
jgi:hypothetical protein